MWASGMLFGNVYSSVTIITNYSVISLFAIFIENDLLQHGYIRGDKPMVQRQN